MIWFTWRQLRTQTVITASAVAALSVVLLISGRSIAHLYTGVTSCQSDCTTAVQVFLTGVRNSASGTLYYVALAVMYGLPAVIGIFWGAPLVARELEAGTHRLAWNQSVTRTRWLATKLAVAGGVPAAATGLLSWAVTAWAHHLDSAAGDRITPLVYGARGVVPIGYALFAFTLGVTAGMLIRRTVPAMAATLGGYLVAAAAMPLWIRSHLVPARHDTPPLDLGNLDFMGIGRDGRMEVMSNGLPNAWTITSRTITASGQVFTGPADPAGCGGGRGPEACQAWLGGLGLRQDVVYHPASHFWALQWTETAIFVALAVLLAGSCFWLIRRRIG
jgi:hypothetical protein